MYVFVCKSRRHYRDAGNVKYVPTTVFIIGCYCRATVMKASN